MQKVSIIVPTYNEEKNVQRLVNRIHDAMEKHDIAYEIIFVDDHSTDRTCDVIHALSNLYPVQCFMKHGKKGKAFSLLEGFTYSKYAYLCMIDADLQYPPEAIPKMLEEMTNADIVVANRQYNSSLTLRKIMSKVQLKLLNQILHGITCDVQSGLKVFKKEVIERLSISPTRWTFDLEFLLKAKQAGYKIDTIDIPFSERLYGKSKVDIWKATLEIAASAIQLKFQAPSIIFFHPSDSFQKGRGFHYKGVPFTHYSHLDISESAFFRLTPTQQKILLSALGAVALGLMFSWHTTIVFIVGILMAFYFTDLLFNLFIIFRNFYTTPEITIKKTDIQQHIWPTYTIFCPLYKETAVLPQFIHAMNMLDYPPDKLQVMLLLEEDDTPTLEKVSEHPLPDYFDIVIVPDSFPKTKPKALNHGLSFATGEYTVIFDAEDIPDPQQLKKVVIAFEKSDPSIACIQAKLNFYNPHQNILTKVFTAEYSLWFDLVLTGLQSINAPIPLGGTSNHFRTKDLIRLKGWDSFNVTEDCDLGVRLAKEGYSTAIVNSTTYEEANSSIKNWFAQRGRWIKGYIQSYFVHIRSPKLFVEEANLSKFIFFQLVVGGKILSLFINPFMWAITITYFVFRPTVGSFIESLFPPIIFYIGILSLVFGNFLYTYYYMIASIKRQHYEITKYAFLVPLYWLFMSVAAWNALYKMILEPHYWAKTIHGLHLQKKTVSVADKFITPDDSYSSSAQRAPNL